MKILFLVVEKVSFQYLERNMCELEKIVLVLIFMWKDIL